MPTQRPVGPPSPAWSGFPRWHQSTTKCWRTSTERCTPPSGRIAIVTARSSTSRFAYREHAAQRRGSAQAQLEKGIYMGADSTNPDAVRRNRRRRRAGILAVDDGARVGLTYLPGIYVDCWLGLPPLRKCRRDADRVVRIV